MGFVYKKKKGITFIEIILALSIIGIISVAIFNNIAFSLKVNKETDGRQNSSILAQHVFEEIKSMGDTRFEELADSMASDSSCSVLGSDFVEIGEIIDSVSKENFGENTETFEVFKKRNTKLYVKVSLPDLNKDSQGAGLANEYTTTVKNNFVQEWKSMNNCDVGMEITKPNQDDLNYKVQFYINGTPGTFFIGTKEQLVPKVSLEGNEIKVYFMKERKFTQTITEESTGKLTKVNMYIKDNTGGNLFYIFSNDEKLGLNIYLEQNTTGNSDFITYGSNIRVYSNAKGETPNGENINTESVCDFTVEVYKKDGNNIIKMIEIKGHKKFKRFEL